MGKLLSQQAAVFKLSTLPNIARLLAEIILVVTVIENHSREGCIKEGLSNGPIQFKSASKVWPLHELLLKIG